MATQLVSLPAHLVQALLDSDVMENWFSDGEGSPMIAFEPLHLSGTETAIAVVVSNPALTWDSWRFHGKNVFTLLLAPAFERACEYLPRPLPDDLLWPVFLAVMSAVRGCLTGHDALELASVLDAARHQPNAGPLQPFHRRPRNRFERRLRENALLLQRRFVPALEELRNEIASYGEALLRSGLGPVIGDLATEGTLAESFGVKLSAFEGSLALYRDDLESIASLLQELEQARSARYVTNWMLGELAPYTPCPRQNLSAFHITQLYRRGFADLRHDIDAPLWRRSDSSYSEFPIAVPAIGIERAMMRLADAFDLHLLADVDPLIKAILCWWQFLRIKPFGQFDRQVAEVLVHVLMRQAGMPPSPLPMIMHRRYWDHASMLQIAFEQEKCDCLVDTMISAVREALRLGRDMIHQLDLERTCLMAGLEDLDASLVDTTAVVSELLSNVLVNQAAGSDLGEAARREYAFEHLHSTGAIDKIVAGDRVWWSSEIARNLADGR